MRLFDLWTRQSFVKEEREEGPFEEGSQVPLRALVLRPRSRAVNWVFMDHHAPGRSP